MSGPPHTDVEVRARLRVKRMSVLKLAGEVLEENSG
jgi:hypothetical protein